MKQKLWQRLLDVVPWPRLDDEQKRICRVLKISQQAYRNRARRGIVCEFYTFVQKVSRAPEDDWDASLTRAAKPHISPRPDGLWLVETDYSFSEDRHLRAYLSPTFALAMQFVRLWHKRQEQSHRAAQTRHKVAMEHISAKVERLRLERARGER